jgi:desulfoferrodoxin-like iron-binding protein
MANQLGKRFQCEKCGTEVLCIKPGNGDAHCCGAPMKLMEPKVLPSAD